MSVEILSNCCIIVWSKLYIKSTTNRSKHNEVGALRLTERRTHRHRRETHDEYGEEKFSLEVSELGHLGDVVESVERVQSALCVQVAIATDQLRRPPVSEAQVLELGVGLLQLTTGLLRQPAVDQHKTSIKVRSQNMMSRTHGLSWRILVHFRHQFCTLLIA